MEENNFVLLVSYQDNLIQLEFDENANVGELKKKIQARTGVEPARQQLVWGTGISDSEVTSDIPLVAMGIEDAIMVFEKPLPQPLPINRQPSLPSREFTRPQTGYLPGQTSFFGNQQIFGEPFVQHQDYDDFHPFLDGRTAIGTTPHPQFGIGSSIKSNDFQRLLDVCECDAELFTYQFEEKYGVIHPSFIGGPFSSFYQANKDSKKPIIIYIHSGSNSDSVFFSSLVLCNPEVVKCLKELDVKFWVGEISKENEQVYKSIFGTPMKYPFCAIVGNISNNFTVIDFINELCAYSEFIKRVKSAATKLENEIEKKRRELEIRNNERRIKEEQNESYQRSQREDKLKEQQKLEDDEMAIVSTASKQTTLQECRKSALDAAANLPKEPDAKSIPKPVRIVISLHDGTKKQRYFDPNNKLELVFIWVSGFIAERLKDETYLDDNSPPFDSVGQAIIPWTIEAYELISSYPKKSYTMKDSNSTLLEVGLAPGGALLVLQRI
jgi:hypothetical protein